MLQAMGCKESQTTEQLNGDKNPIEKSPKYINWHFMEEEIKKLSTGIGKYSVSH